MLTEFVMKHFDVHQSTENGTHHVVTAIQKGKTEINAALNSVIKKVSHYLLLFEGKFFSDTC